MKHTRKADPYGLTHASYSGDGILHGKRGEEDPCSFDLFQLRDGNVIALSEVRNPDFERALEFNTADSLTGKTTDGCPISATGLFEIAYLPLPVEKEDVVYRAHICREVQVGESLAGSSSGPSRFAVTNLKIARPVPIHHPSAQGQIRRIDEYDERLRRLEFSKSVDVTAELTIESADPGLRNQVAQDVCQLLSLARGGRVQWISRVDYSPSGAIAHRYHASLVTKPYSTLPIIDPRDRDDTTRFLDVSLPTFLARKKPWGLDTGLLDAYLDAKGEEDFLQLRGVKLAVALEMLKSSMIAAEEAREFVRTRSEFGEIVPLLKRAVRDILVQQGWQKADRTIAYTKLQELNRVPFRDLVDSLCSSVGLGLPEQDRRLFVKCRNSLVHRGRFYCESATPEERHNCPPHDTVTQEFFWLLHVLDRLFLRLVSYDGPWIDWSTPGNPQRRDRLLAS